MNTLAHKHSLALGLGLLLSGLLLFAILFVPSTANMEQMQESTVRILCKAKDRISAGSGFVVATEPATYIVTNNHVARCAPFEEQQGLAVVLSRKQTIPLQIKWYDADKDLAIVRSTEPLGRPAVQFADTVSVTSGAPVTVVGFPRGADEVVDSPDIAVPSVSRGNVSRIVPGANGARYFQHTAPSNPGNSGGPVYDEAGYVIGVNSLKPVAGGEGIAAAVDAAEVLPQLEKLQVSYGMTSSLSAISMPTTLVAAAVALILVAAGILILAPSGRDWLFRRRASPAKDGQFKARVGKIRILNGALAGMEVSIAGKVVLGRDPIRAQVVFPGDDTAVSRRHCEISFNQAAGQFEIRDLKSRNGTFVTKDVGSPRRLTPDIVECVPPGQNILVGSTRNRLVLELS
jgi:S1-C subfamily serine protease